MPAFVQLAAEIGVKEVYLQRLVFFDQSAIGKARPDQALFERLTREEAGYLKQAEDLARSLGITFSASGAASEPGLSLKRTDDGLALVALPAALVADVFHRQWPGAALLYRAVFAAWLRQLHFGQCNAANLAGNLERARVSGISQGSAVR